MTLPLRGFAITVYVDAVDAVAAIDAAGDIWANPEAVQIMAGLGEGVDVRPADELRQALKMIDGETG